MRAELELTKVSAHPRANWLVRRRSHIEGESFWEAILCGHGLWFEYNLPTKQNAKIVICVSDRRVPGAIPFTISPMEEANYTDRCNKRMQEGLFQGYINWLGDNGFDEDQPLWFWVELP